MSKFVWKISPSTIERFFSSNNCLRCLAGAGLKSDQENKNDPAKKFGFCVPNNHTSAIAEAGNKWEFVVLEKIRKKNFSIIQNPETVDKNGKKRIDKFSSSELKEELKKLYEQGYTGNRCYIYQGGLEVTDTFIKKYITNRNDSDACVLDDNKIGIVGSKAFPDLLRVEWTEDKTRLFISVIDIKLSKRPKIEHKMQIAMYVLMLKDLIEHDGSLAGKVIINEDKSYLFNFGLEEEHAFDVRIVFDFLQEFFRNDLAKLISVAQQDIPDEEKFFSFPYHISPNCEWCPNHDKCIDSLLKENSESIMLLPYLSVYAQDHIRSVSMAEQKPEILTLKGLEEFCKKSENQEKLKDNNYWKRFLIHKDENLKMLSAACKREKNQYMINHVPMTEHLKNVNLKMIITAQKDNGYDRCYYWGVALQASEDKKEILKDILQTAMEAMDSDGCMIRKDQTDDRLTIGIIVKDMAKQSAAAETFVGLWYEILLHISDHNSKNSSLFLQHYVMDNYELTNTEDTLMHLIADEDSPCREKASALMMLLQGQNLVGNTDIAARPSSVVSCPVMILSDLVRKHFILPSIINNRLIDICEAFLDHATAERLNDVSFVNKRSNYLRSDLINDYWDQKNNDGAERLSKYMEERFSAEFRLIDKIFQIKGSSVSHELAPFTMPEYSRLSNDKLRYLLFEAQYEHQLAINRNRANRGAEFEFAVDEGKLLLLKLTNKKAEPKKYNGFTYTLECELAEDSGYMRNEKFFSAALFLKNKAGIEALPFYNEALAPNENRKFLEEHFQGVEFFEGTTKSPSKDSKKDTTALQFKYTQNNKFVPMQNDPVYQKLQDIAIGTEFILTEKTFDRSMKINQKALTEADDNKNIFFTDPHSTAFYKKFPDTTEATFEKLSEYGNIAGRSFTDSQRDALKQLYKYNITLLLGPPGTGKTDFIGRAVISFVRLYESAEKKLRVLICANSHAAIENALLSAYHMAENADNIYFVKMGGMNNGDANNNIHTNIWNIPENRHCIIGSTVWAIYNAKDTVGMFDLIVIDEASQLRMVDAVIPLMLGDRDKTRFLIVGDEDQLPPIISGKYEKEPDKPYLFGSVFRYYYDCDRLKKDAAPSYIVSLQENFRMNEAISDYSAQKIYNRGGAVYHPYNDEIGNQSLAEYGLDREKILRKLEEIYPGEKDNDAIADILDPAYPLVLCETKGENGYDMRKTEVRYVTKCVKILQHLLKEVRGGAYNSEDFWGVMDSKDKIGDFGIVSPHHANKAVLKRSIMESQDRSPEGWKEDKSKMMIDTVDKLQGQQRQIIIVSYGVADIQQALEENEFIFSRNRLNVAITRAKKKCILFLNDAVLSYPITALTTNDEDLIAGFDYVCGFRNHMISGEKPKELEDIILYRKKYP